MEKHEINVIARLYSDFDEKFGIPRQSGLAKTAAKVVFEPEYRSAEAVRGIEGYSHLWLIWQFSASVRETWSPTVRPPRLGGNERMGVFATRSPFRPNSIGLSSVRLERLELDPKLGPVLHVSGADMLNGTPIYDIKPYVRYTDSHEDAVSGFADTAPERLRVEVSESVRSSVSEYKLAALIEVLENDPRPSYQNDGERVYGMSFGGLNVKFRVDGGTLYLLSAESNR